MRNRAIISSILYEESLVGCTYELSLMKPEDNSPRADRTPDAISTPKATVSKKLPTSSGNDAVKAAVPDSAEEQSGKGNEAGTSIRVNLHHYIRTQVQA